MRVWQATAAAIQRTTELVNRTNQFNTTGAWVSYAQMLDWSHSPWPETLISLHLNRSGSA